MLRITLDSLNWSTAAGRFAGCSLSGLAGFVPKSGAFSFRFAAAWILTNRMCPAIHYRASVRYVACKVARERKAAGGGQDKEVLNNTSQASTKG